MPYVRSIYSCSYSATPIRVLLEPCTRHVTNWVYVDFTGSDCFRLDIDTLSEISSLGDTELKELLLGAVGDLLNSFDNDVLVRLADNIRSMDGEPPLPPPPPPPPSLGPTAVTRSLEDAFHEAITTAAETDQDVKAAIQDELSKLDTAVVRSLSALPESEVRRALVEAAAQFGMSLGDNFVTLLLAGLRRDRTASPQVSNVDRLGPVYVAILAILRRILLGRVTGIDLIRDAFERELALLDVDTLRQVNELSEEELRDIVRTAAGDIGPAIGGDVVLGLIDDLIKIAQESSPPGPPPRPPPGGDARPPPGQYGPPTSYEGPPPPVSYAGPQTEPPPQDYAGPQQPAYQAQQEPRQSRVSPAFQQNQRRSDERGFERRGKVSPEFQADLFRNDVDKLVLDGDNSGSGGDYYYYESGDYYYDDYYDGSGEDSNVVPSPSTRPPRPLPTPPPVVRPNRLQQAAISASRRPVSNGRPATTGRPSNFRSTARPRPTTRITRPRTAPTRGSTRSRTSTTATRPRTSTTVTRPRTSTTVTRPRTSTTVTRPRTFPTTRPSTVPVTRAPEVRRRPLLPTRPPPPITTTTTTTTVEDRQPKQVFGPDSRETAALLCIPDGGSRLLHLQCLEPFADAQEAELIGQRLLHLFCVEPHEANEDETNFEHLIPLAREALCFTDDEFEPAFQQQRVLPAYSGENGINPRGPNGNPDDTITFPDEEDDEEDDDDIPYSAAQTLAKLVDIPRLTTRKCSEKDRECIEDFRAQDVRPGLLALLERTACEAEFGTTEELYCLSEDKKKRSLERSARYN